MAPPLMRYFGTELRLAREAVGATRKQLADAVIYSESKVGAVEPGEQLPTLAFCERADAFLGTDGRFARMRKELLQTEVFPEEIRPYLAAEQEATAIWTYELSVIPGLFQTEAYARALLDGEDARVAGRLERQAILDRERPPDLMALIDERVLRHPVGDPGVMYEQLKRLVDLAGRFIIQVVPLAARTYLHLDGPFAIASIDGHELVYVDAAVRGFAVEDPEVASRMRRRWDIIRAEALPRRLSVELMQEVMEQWT